MRYCRLYRAGGEDAWVILSVFGLAGVLCLLPCSLGDVRDKRDLRGVQAVITPQGYSVHPSN